jgi:hypothetical protein
VHRARSCLIVERCIRVDIKVDAIEGVLKAPLDLLDDALVPWQVARSL